MADLQHFLLTRFNVREEPDKTELISDPGWLGHRFGLFEEFCLPSVAAQTVPEFTWLIFFDEATPGPFRQRIEQHAQTVPNLRPVYVVEHSQAVVAEVLSHFVHGSASHVITSRLDNDDAVSRDYIERIQRAFSHQDCEVLNFPYGIVWHKGRAYLHHDPSNAFATLVEKRTGSNLLTVCARPHPKLSQVASVRQLDGGPGWLQTVHGTNQRNRVRGWRVHSNEVSHLFALEPTVAPAPSQGVEFLIDRYFLSGLRQTREQIIRVAKLVMSE